MKLACSANTISRLVTEASPIGIVVMNCDGRLVYVNPAFEEITGLARGELIGCAEQLFDAKLAELSGAELPNPKCAMQPAQCKVVVHPSLALLQPGTCQQREEPRACHCTITLQRPKVTSLRRSLRVVDDAAEGMLRIFFFEVVTHEKALEKLKTEFIINASHELRTPLAIINGYAEMLLLKEMDAATQGGMLRSLHLHSVRLTDQLEKMLDLGRLEQRLQNRVPLQRVDLGQLLVRVCGEFEHCRDERRPQLDLGEGDYACSGDAALLTKCITELLNNACQYSFGKGVISVAVHAAVGGRCGFTIEDQGIGMTAQETAQIFERFWRADKSGKHPGAGLGMSIVKDIVALHGGRIVIASMPARGTRVTVWLPAAA